MVKGKSAATLVVAGVSFAIVAAEPQTTAVVNVDLTQDLGPIRVMNAVNNGPSVSKAGDDQKRGNFDTYQAARIPYARTHDSVNCVSGGAHTCDIGAIFPDFDADENDPRNYDFVFTDHYLDTIRRAGTEVYYRLGQTIEHGPKKYGSLPPKDFAKWARICEHVIRHYNEGWGWGLDNAYTTRNIAWSNQFNIVYWEIWNEPDLDAMPGDEVSRNPRCWGGSVTNFFRFFSTAAKHLKSRFPQLKIGGPALAGRWDFAENLLAYCRDEKVPLDFFSWHWYSVDPATAGEFCDQARGLLDKYGYGKTESILNEWNYVKGWSDDFVYSMEVESGRFNQKCAAFIATTMTVCQSKPLDMLMFYDARTTTVMNSLFDGVTLLPLRGYYPFYAWSKLTDCGRQVACSVKEGRGTRAGAASGVAVGQKETTVKNQYHAVAAKGAGGSGAVLITRYSSDDNCSDTGKVWVSVPGVDLSKARCHMTDAVRIHTEVPLSFASDGAAVFSLQPNSFALIEF